jgi:hypothetical protein
MRTIDHGARMPRDMLAANHALHDSSGAVVECNYSIDRKSGCDPVVVIEQAPQTFTPLNDAFL